MNTKIRSFAFCLTACLLACFSGHAYEQDNWYLANEWSVSSPHGLAYYKDNSSGVGQIYVCNQITTSSRISVYDLNGSLDRHITIAQTRQYANDLALDGDGNIYIGENFAVTCLSNDGSFQWRTGKNASASSYGTSGSGDGEFNSVLGITIGPDNLLYVAERNNHRIQVLDKNGNFVRMFGSYGTAPGQLNYPRSLGFLPDGVLVIRDKQKIHWFEADGTFIKRMNEDNNDLGDGNLATFQSGGFLTYISRHPTQSYVYDAFFLDSDGSTIANFTNTRTTSNSSMKYATTPSGDVFTSLSNKIKYYKRAYRTKGLVNSNAIPHPKIHKISQRAGTNVLDLDFEIIDTDDANATIGIIAYAGSDKLVPKTWVDGTGSKINSPITTNQVHRVSWDVKQDWATSTGTIKFEILCQDGRTNKPVDLHFLTLPFQDGNMTISRSPLKDSDFQNYAKYLLAKGDAQFASDISNEAVLAADANATELFIFTNCGKTGRSGPTEAQMQSAYNGTNLQGFVTTGWKDGYQKWTVPVTGEYWIEAVGAAGGSTPTRTGGMGAFIRGKFNLASGQELNILVGQKGADNVHNNRGAGGGGGTFVVADSNNTPLVIAGGGAGAGGSVHINHHASALNNGHDGSYSGGTNGLGGQGERGAGGGGFAGAGSGNGGGGSSYQLGAVGGDSPSDGRDGGFGGGGATYYMSDNAPGGGGGFSGGGGSEDSTPYVAGGGGSFNSGSSQTNIFGFGGGHGLVRIYSANGVVPTFPSVIIADRSHRPLGVYAKLLIDLGSGYRFATTSEVTKAREAATPGSVNNWTASVQVKPRNLPGNVNEYGFDVYTTSGYWVIKE